MIALGRWLLRLDKVWGHRCPPLVILGVPAVRSRLTSTLPAQCVWIGAEPV